LSLKEFHQLIIQNQAKKPEAAGSYSIIVSNAVFSTGTAANYSITYTAGTYTINAAGARSQTVTFTSTAPTNANYGGTYSVTGSASSGLPANITSSTPDVCELVGGNVNFKSAGECILSINQAGGTNADGTFGAAEQVQQSFTIGKAPIVLTGTDKEKNYGDAAPSFTFSLTSGTLFNSDQVDGVDFKFTDLNLTTAPTNAGTYSINISNANFGSGRIENYSVTYVPGTYTINPRPMTITVQNQIKLTGQNDPTFSHSIEGLASVDTAAVLGAVTYSRSAGEAVGDYAITASYTDPQNYSVTKVNGKLKIASIAFNVQEANGELTDRTVTCECQNLNPGSSLELAIFSTPTVLNTGTASNDGSCPLSGVIPGSVTDGDHTLRLIVNDPGGATLTQNRPVRLPGLQITGGGGGNNPPPNNSRPPSNNPNNTVTNPTPSAEPTTESTSEQQNGRNPRPTVTGPSPTPTRFTPNDQPNNSNSPNIGALPAPTPRVTPTPTPTTTPVDTIDNGRGGAIVATGPMANANQLSENSNVRSLGELSREVKGGFAPNAAVTIEVVGARTTGQFLIVPGEILDPFVIATALRESTARTATDFARISNATSVPAPSGNQNLVAGQLSTEMIETLKESKLLNPLTVDQLDIPENTSWIRITADVSTYKPGSEVYLVVTSQPIIFGVQKVGLNGTAEISGLLPLQALQSGGHAVRVVGTRYIEGAYADENGEIALTSAALGEIQKFDMGTQATVKLIGPNSTGGNHLVMREVPLDIPIPWWTLWIVGWTALLFIVLKLWRKIATRKEKIVASAITLISIAPALWFGWTSFSYLVMGLGALIGVVGAGLIWLLPPVIRSSDNQKGFMRFVKAPATN
jgi:hypothetical protein